MPAPELEQEIPAPGQQGLGCRSCVGATRSSECPQWLPRAQGDLRGKACSVPLVDRKFPPIRLPHQHIQAGLRGGTLGWARASRTPGQTVPWLGRLAQGLCREWRLTLCPRLVGTVSSGGSCAQLSPWCRVFRSSSWEPPPQVTGQRLKCSGLPGTSGAPWGALLPILQAPQDTGREKPSVPGSKRLEGG